MQSMTREEILEKLKEILLSVDESKRDLILSADENVDFKKDFGFSSVNTLFLIIAIEETFGIRFENVTMDSFSTIGDVITYLENLLR